MSDAAHPVWKLLERITFMAFLFAMMAIFAGDLTDLTEVKSAIGMGIGFAVREWFQAKTAPAAAVSMNSEPATD